MSHSFKKKFGTHTSSIAVISLLMVGTLMTSITKFSYADNNINPSVFPVDSKPYGLTYGEWTVRFWQ